MIKFLKAAFVTAVAIALCAYAAMAQAEDSWTCAIASEDKDAPPLMTRYTVKGDALVSDRVDDLLRKGVPYRLLQNNDDSLVAVSPQVWDVGDLKEVGFVAVVIAKANGVFLSQLTLTGGMLKPMRVETSHGSCLRGSSK